MRRLGITRNKENEIQSETRNVFPRKWWIHTLYNSILSPPMSPLCRFSDGFLSSRIAKILASHRHTRKPEAIFKIIFGASVKQWKWTHRDGDMFVFWRIDMHLYVCAVRMYALVDSRHAQGSSFRIQFLTAQACHCYIDKDTPSDWVIWNMVYIENSIDRFS